MHPLLIHALQYTGQRERKGQPSNPIILDMIQTVFPNWKDDSTIAWCACFMNYVCISMCYEHTMHLPHPGLAREWLKVGTPVKRKDLRVGDVVIFNRGGWKGHVGFFLADFGEDGIEVFGGNQSNGISVARYTIPFLGGRRLRSGPKYEFHV